MSSVLLHLHMGLGDHFSTHGIVREYAKKYSRVGVFSKPHNYPTVAFMFGDLPNVQVIEVENDEGAEAFIWKNVFTLGKHSYSRVVIAGFERFEWQSNEPFEKQFYALANVPFEKKWDSFYIERVANREEKINALLPQGPFAFVHDDIRYPTDSGKLPSLPLFRPQKEMTDNVCDYIGAIERASEIHVIDSSFMFLIDCLKYGNPKQKLFVHRYARPNKESMLPVLKKDWTILA
jgi:hypothetical protein